MTVGGSVTLLIDILQRRQRPAGEVLAAICSNAAELVHIRPVLIPVSTQRHKRALRNCAILRLILLDILNSHRIMHILRHLRRNINHAQRKQQMASAKRLGQRLALSKMSREVDMRAILSRKFEGLNQALQHRVAPVENRLSHLYGAFRNPGPHRTVIIHRVRQLHPRIRVRLQFV